MPEDPYITHTNTNLTVETHKISVPDYIVITQRGRVVGSVEATFNIKEVPPELNLSVINYLLQQRTRLQAPGTKPPPTEGSPHREEPPEEPWWKFW